MNEVANGYVKYLSKFIETLDKCIKAPAELKIEVEGTLSQLKNNELSEQVEKDKNWQEIKLKFRRVQMMLVEVRLSHILFIVRQEVGELEGLHQDLKNELGPSKGGEDEEKD